MCIGPPLFSYIKNNSRNHCEEYNNIGYDRNHSPNGIMILVQSGIQYGGLPQAGTYHVTHNPSLHSPLFARQYKRPSRGDNTLHLTPQTEAFYYEKYIQFYH